MLTITPRIAYEDIAVPEKIYESVYAADAVTEGGLAFEIHVGLNESLVDQLRAYSCDLSDTALQENTSDYKRFCEGDFVADFDQKNRLYFSLVERDTGKLASIFWLSPGALPGADYDTEMEREASWDTVAFRTYGEYRGIGVTKAFNAYVFDYIDAVRVEYPLWLVVSEDNEPGIRLYHNLGFQDVGTVSEKKKIVMLRDQRQ